MTVELSVVTIVYVATCIAAVGAAIKVLFEAKKALQKPFEDMQAKCEHYDECLERDKKHLEKIDTAIEELGQATNLLVSASRITLAHLKDGNNTGEIDKKVKEIDEWLIERKDYRI